MADSILRLKVESQEYDNKLKRASEGIQRYADQCRKVGGTLEVVEKETLDFVRSIGQMGTVSTTAKGKINEMSSSFINLTAQYKQLTETEKQSPFGKALSQSLDQLKERTQEAKQELSDITKELNGASNIGGGGGLFSSDKLSGMLQVFGGNLMTKGLELATGAVSSLASEIGGMITQGVELARQGEGVRIAFERLGRGDILQGLREATHGTVTDLELMKAAVKFNDFKLPLDQLGTMLAFAQQKAKDTGQSVDYMVESITNGLGRQSKPILDNLGISAKEIEQRMKSTGDFTKAVGEIIRDQMAKAGDYVETAADRAAQANVSLQNKMEELGRKFAPLEEASNRLWTSMKMGILDIIGGPLTQLLNGLTEAGRINNSMQKHGGNDRVSGQVQRYRVAKANGSSYMANYIDQQNLKSYDDEINRLQFTIAAYGKGRDAVEKGNIARLKEELQGVRDLRAEYIRMRNEADRPSVINSPTTTTTKTTKATKTGKTTDQIIREQFADQQRDSLAYSSSYKSTATDQPSDAWRAFTESQTQTSKSIEDALKALNKKEGVTARGKGNEKKKQDDALKQDKSAVQVLGQMNSGISGIMSGIEGLGIELPQGMRDMVSGISSVLSVLQGISILVEGIAAIQQVGTWLGLFANGGIVPHAAGGYFVGGSHYSGDVTPIMANAGELVLSRSQQFNLASQLEGNGMQGLNLTATIRGEQIRLALNNNSRRRGRGEYVTSKNVK